MIELRPISPAEETKQGIPRQLREAVALEVIRMADQRAYLENPDYAKDALAEHQAAKMPLESSGTPGEGATPQGAAQTQPTTAAAPEVAEAAPDAATTTPLPDDSVEVSPFNEFRERVTSGEGGRGLTDTRGMSRGGEQREAAPHGGRGTAEGGMANVNAILYGAVEAVDWAIDAWSDWVVGDQEWKGRKIPDLTEAAGLTAPPPDDTSAQVFAVASQFGVGMLLPGAGLASKGAQAVLGPAAKWLAGTGKAGAAAVKTARGVTGGAGVTARGAWSDAIAHDPNQGALQNLFNAFPATQRLADHWLVARDPNDPEHYNRMRNAVEGMIIGGVLGGTIHAGSKLGAKVMSENITNRLHEYVLAAHKGRPSVGDTGPDGKILKDAVNRETAENAVAFEQAVQDKIAQRAKSASSALEDDAVVIDGVHAAPDLTPEERTMVEMLVNKRAAGVELEPDEVALLQRVEAPKVTPVEMSEDELYELDFLTKKEGAHGLDKGEEATKKRLEDKKAGKAQEKPAEEPEGRTEEAIEAELADTRAELTALVRNDPKAADGAEGLALRQKVKGLGKEMVEAMGRRGPVPSAKQAETRETEAEDAAEGVEDEESKEERQQVDIDPVAAAQRAELRALRREEARGRPDQPISRSRWGVVDTIDDLQDRIAGADFPKRIEAARRMLAESDDPVLVDHRLLANLEILDGFARDAGVYGLEGGEKGAALSHSVWRSYWNLRAAPPETEAVRRGEALEKFTEFAHWLHRGSQGVVKTGAKFDQETFTRWQLDARNRGRNNPTLNPESEAAAPGPATTRAQTVAEVRAEEPPDFGKTPMDKKLIQVRPERIPGLQVGNGAPPIRGYDPVAAVNDPIDTRFGQINNTDEDFAVLDETIGIARRGERTHGEITRSILAKGVRNEDAADMVSDLVRKYGIDVTALNPSRLNPMNVRRGGSDIVHKDPEVALYTIQSMAGTIQRMAVTASAEGATATQRGDVLKALHKQYAYMRKLLGQDKEAADAMQRAGLSMTDSQDPVYRRMNANELIAASGGSDNVDAIINALANSKPDVESVLRISGAWRDRAEYAWGLRRGLSAHKAFSTFLEIRSDSMLGNMASRARDIMVGNPAYFLLEMSENYAAARLPKALGGEGVASAQAERELSYQLVGYASAMKKASKAAWDDAKFQALGGSDPVDLVTGEYRPPIKHAEDQLAAERAQKLHANFISQDRLDVNTRAKQQGVPTLLRDAMMAKGGWMAKTAHFLDQGIGQAGTLSHTVIQAGDVFNKTPIYDSEVARLAANQAARENLTGKAYSVRVAALRENTEALAPDIHDQAMDAAHRGTFTQAPEGKGLLDKPTQMTIEYRNRNPGVAIALPFITTLNNITNATVDRVPILNLLPTQAREALAKGGRPRAQVISRTMTGAGLIYGGHELQQAGILTGGMAGTPEQRAAAFRQGWRPYSVRATRDDGSVVYIGYNKIPVIGALLGTGANIAHMSLAAQNADELGQSVNWFHAGSTVFGGLMHDFWFNAVSEFYEVAASGSAEKIERWMKGFTESIIPKSGLARNAERIFDTDAGPLEPGREGALVDEMDRDLTVLQALWNGVKEGTDNAMSRYGILNGQFPKIEPLSGGQPTQWLPETDGVADMMINAGLVVMGGGHARPHPAREEYMRLGVKIGRMDEWMPSGGNARGFEEVHVRLSTEQNHYLERQADVFRTREARKLVESTMYKVANDRTKRAALELLERQSKDAAFESVLKGGSPFKGEMEDMVSDARAIMDRRAKIERERSRERQLELEAGDG